MAFWTERQIEEWLVRETRDLPMPSGGTQPHTAFRLVWRKVDSLILVNGHSLLELVGFAQEEAHLQSIGFDEAFTGIVSWLDDQRRNTWDIS